jgi:hypothetical protein
MAKATKMTLCGTQRWLKIRKMMFLADLLEMEPQVEASPLWVQCSKIKQVVVP